MHSGMITMGLEILKSYMLCRTLGLFFFGLIYLALEESHRKIPEIKEKDQTADDNKEREIREKEIREKEILRLQLKMYQRQLGVMEEQNHAGRLLRHDIKQHTRMLADYICEGQNDKALAYMEKMKLYAGGSRHQIETGNGDVDSILNYFMEETDRIGGSAAMNVRILPGLIMDSFDMNVILGNLLLNACEAMQKSTKRELSVDMEYARGIFTVRVKNTYNGVLKQENGRILTSKDETKTHGMGLESIRKMVEKYDGDMEIHYDPEEFWVTVFLFVPSVG